MCSEHIVWYLQCESWTHDIKLFVWLGTGQNTLHKPACTHTHTHTQSQSHPATTTHTHTRHSMALMTANDCPQLKRARCVFVCRIRAASATAVRALVALCVLVCRMPQSVHSYTRGTYCCPYMRARSVCCAHLNMPSMCPLLALCCVQL